MTDRIAQIQARLDAATPGPWEDRVDDRTDEVDVFHDQEQVSFVASCGDKSQPRVLADAMFIANAPEDVAFLLSQLAEVTNQRDQARTHRRAAWDAGYAAAILDIGNEFEPCSTNPWLPGQDGTP